MPIKPDEPYTACPKCGFKHAFVYGPLFVITSASDTGKSTICSRLTGINQNAVLLDSDILWMPGFDLPETGYRSFFET